MEEGRGREGRREVFDTLGLNWSFEMGWRLEEYLIDWFSAKSKGCSLGIFGSLSETYLINISILSTFITHLPGSNFPIHRTQTPSQTHASPSSHPSNQLLNPLLHPLYHTPYKLTLHNPLPQQKFTLISPLAPVTTFTQTAALVGLGH
jgi:hypothetical protein